MFPCKPAVLALLIAGVSLASGSAAMLARAHVQLHAPTPPQIDPIDLMSSVHDLPTQSVENPV